MLLGKHIKVKGSSESMKIEGVKFLQNEPPKLIVTMNGGQVFKDLAEITEVI